MRVLPKFRSECPPIGLSPLAAEQGLAHAPPGCPPDVGLGITAWYPVRGIGRMAAGIVFVITG